MRRTKPRSATSTTGKISSKYLIESSYLPLEVLNTIKDDRDILSFSHKFPHWFQRKISNVKQVFDIGIPGWGYLYAKKEKKSGIFTSVSLDSSHEMVFCAYKYAYNFEVIQNIVRMYKILQKAVNDINFKSCLCIESNMDFQPGLPDEFFTNCPQWSDEVIEEESDRIDQTLNKVTKTFLVQKNKRNSVDILCNTQYVSGGWNITIIPYDTSEQALECYLKAKSSIDKLYVKLKEQFLFPYFAIGVIISDNCQKKIKTMKIQKQS